MNRLVFGFWCLVFGVLVMGSVSAISICIDNEDPGAPSGLAVSGDVGSILIEWGDAVDSPNCSGIFEYVVSRDGIEIGRMADGGLSMVDGASLGNGEYAYTVYAVDLVGRNAGASVKNVVSVRRGGSSGGSSSSGFVCVVNWSCGEWSDCVDGNMTRVCVDLEECGTPHLKPVGYLECGGEVASELDVVEPDVEEDEGFFSAVTGAVTGVVGTTEGVVGGVFVLILLLGFVAIRIKKKF